MNNKKTMSKSEAQTRLLNAKVLIAEAKAETEFIKAKQAKLDFDRSCDALCYIDTATNEFNRKLTPAIALIKSLPVEIATALNLNPKQHEQLSRIIDNVMTELSNIEFEFETSSEVDKRTAAAHGNGLKVK